MDCLICFKIFIKETEYENISPPKSDICVRSMCKLLEISNSSRIQDIFKDPAICSKCYQRLEKVYKELIKFEEIQRNNYKIRGDIEKDLNNSKNVMHVMQNAYGREMSKSSKNRLELLQVIENKPSNDVISTSVEMDALPQEIPIDQSTTLPLSPQSESIPNLTKGNQLMPRANILSEMKTDIQSPPISMNEILRNPQQGTRKYPQKVGKTQKSRHSKYSFCKICKAKFSSRSTLSRHMNQHFSMKERQRKPEESLNHFICSECGRPHKLETELQTHLESALDSKNIQKCSICSEEFWGIKCLEYHVTIHHNQDQKLDENNDKQKQEKSNPNQIWKCSVCNFKFEHERHLKRHELLHGPKKFKCPIDGCGMKFHRDDYLKIHLAKQAHSKPKGSQCLQIHQENSTSKRESKDKTEWGNLFECPECGIKFGRRSSLFNHRLIHGPKKFKCSIVGCGMKFYRKGNLKNHLGKVHTERKRAYEQKYQCQFCSRKFWKKDALSYHLRDEKPTECPICHESFKTVGCLNHHNSIHGISYKGKKIMKSQTHRCNICNKILSSKKALKTHKAVHEDPKFKCPENDCKRMFNYKHNMARHINVIHNKF